MSGLAEALEKRYPAPAWALFHEVANGTGWNWNRHADAIAMGIWPSRGLEVHGLEFKASRTDWLREMKNPQKAEDMVRYCDYWWLVTTEQGIAHIDEIPAEWGHLNLKGSKLYTLKAAPKRVAAQLDKGFVAAIIRKVYDLLNNSERMKDKIHAAFKKGSDHAKDMSNSNLALAQAELKQAKDQIEKFEKESGIKLNTWDAGDIGKAVRAFLGLNRRDWKRELLEVAQRFEGAAQGIRSQVGLIQ